MPNESSGTHLSERIRAKEAAHVLQLSVNGGEIHAFLNPAERIGPDLVDFWSASGPQEQQPQDSTEGERTQVQENRSGNSVAIDWSSKNVEAPSKKRKFAHGGGSPRGCRGSVLRPRPGARQGLSKALGRLTAGLLTAASLRSARRTSNSSYC